MEPGYTYSATADSQAENSAKEPKAPEGTLLRQVQDAKESIVVLKNQVSFADQCLSLLHNQMKHASDTLAILQDQVELAQKTVNSLTQGTVAGLAIPPPQTTTATPTSTRPRPSWVPPRSDSDEQRVFVQDSEGPKVYTLSKSSISLGNPVSITSECAASHEHGQAPCVLHQVPVHCHCPACLSHVTSHHVSQPCHPSCHGPPGTAVVDVSPEVPPPPQSASVVSSYVVGADRTTAQAQTPTSKGMSSHEHSKESSTDEHTSVKKEAASTSPMAHQLLQVIDVLQTVDDDDGSASRSATMSLASLSRGIPNPQGTPYGQGAASWQRVSRRNRKQNMSPMKVVVSSHSSSSVSQDKPSPATADSQAENSAKEPKAPEGTLLRQVQDAKESIVVLKNQVSFADQCLSLLHNQMKHASDTLAILQDQVELAQKTVNSLTQGTVAGLAIPPPQTTTATPTSTRPRPSWVPPRSDSDEQRVFVQDSEGPKVYTLSKSSISLGNPVSITSECAASHEHGQAPCVLHQVPVHCHCPACLSHVTSHHVSQPCHPSCHGPPGTAVVDVSPEVPPPPQSASVVSSYVVGADRTTAQAQTPTSKGMSSHEHSKESSTDEHTSVKKEAASTSPMAHQLLQVIDVLQTVDDDDGSASRSATMSLASLSRGIPNPQGTPYGQGAASWQRVSRRNRKQNMSPMKVVVSSHSSSSVSQDKPSPVRTVIREHSELMRVPAPVLASSLEPEFLVVPTSSFSYDSPPTSSASEEGAKDNTKISSEIVLTKRTMSSSSHEEPVGSVTVSGATKTHTPVEPCDSVHSGNEPFEKCKTNSCCSVDSNKNPLEDKIHPSGLVKNQQSDTTVDLNGASSPLSSKKRLFTGTSPLNSDIGMPFTSKVQSSSCHNSACSRKEPIVTTMNKAVVVSHLEHVPEKSSVLSTTNHVTGSQAPPMTVISLPSTVENSANSVQKPSTPTTKKPIILSRRSSRSSEQNIPQGLVVLVPTIEDVKRLIASTGGQSDGHTPVLVPQHMLNEIHSKNTVTEDQLDKHRQMLGKRNRDMVSPPISAQSKRPAVDSVVID